MKNLRARIGQIVIMGILFTPRLLLAQVSHNYPDRDTAQAIVLGFVAGFVVFWIGAAIGQVLETLAKKVLSRRAKTVHHKAWKNYLLIMRLIFHLLGAIIIGIGAMISIYYGREGFLSSGKLVIEMGLLITALAVFISLFSDSDYAVKRIP